MPCIFCTICTTCTSRETRLTLALSRSTLFPLCESLSHNHPYRATFIYCSMRQSSRYCMRMIIHFTLLFWLISQTTCPTWRFLMDQHLKQKIKFKIKSYVDATILLFITIILYLPFCWSDLVCQIEYMVAPPLYLLPDSTCTTLIIWKPTCMDTEEVQIFKWIKGGSSSPVGRLVFWWIWDFRPFFYTYWSMATSDFYCP